MSTEARGYNPEEPTEESDPLAAFDALLNDVSTEAKEKKIKPKRKKKEEQEAIIEATTERSQNFGELATMGTYEDLRKVNFELYLVSVGKEVGEEAPSDLEEKLEYIKGINDRLDKFNNLEESIKENPQMVAAADKMRQSAEVIMKEWATKLQEQFETIRKSSEFERSVTDESIRAILDSSVYTAEIRVEKETYRDYINKTVEATVGKISGRVRAGIEIANVNNNLKEYSRGYNTGLRLFGGTDGIEGQISRGVISATDAEKKLKTFRAELENKTEGDKEGLGTKVRELYEKYFGEKKSFDISNNSYNYDTNIQIVMDEISKISRVVESIKNNGEISKTSIELFAEEKMKNIVKVIEEELDDEEDRRTALEFVKKYFPARETFRASSDAEEKNGKKAWINTVTKFSVPIPNMKKDELPPNWILKCLKEYNEIEIFEQCVFPTNNTNSFDDRSLSGKLAVDQNLRAVLGEDSFGGVDFHVTEDIRQKNNYHHLFIGTTTSGNIKHDSKVPSVMTLNPDLFVRAASTSELLEQGNAYGFDIKNRLRDARIFVNSLSRDISFDSEGKLSLHTNKQAEAQREWKEEIGRRRSARKPTGREVIDQVIADNGGIYPISTIDEAAGLIEALKRETLAALQRSEASKLSKTEARSEADNEITNLDSELKKAKEELAELERKLLEANTRNESLSNQVDERNQIDWQKSETIRQQEERLTELKNAEAERKKKLDNMAQFITNGLEEAEKISSIIGEDRKKRIALEALFANIQALISSLS